MIELDFMGADFGRVSAPIFSLLADMLRAAVETALDKDAFEAVLHILHVAARLHCVDVPAAAPAAAAAAPAAAGRSAWPSCSALSPDPSELCVKCQSKVWVKK